MQWSSGPSEIHQVYPRRKTENFLGNVLMLFLTDADWPILNDPRAHRGLQRALLSGGQLQ